MKLLTIEQIMKLQKEFGIDDLQEEVLTKELSKIRGIHGSQALNYLQMGALFLPEKTSISVNGDIVPSREFFQGIHDDFGTLKNSVNFWGFVTKRVNKKGFKEAFMYERDARILLSVMEN